MQRQVTLEEFTQRGAQGQLVADRQFNIDPLNAITVITHARQGDDHILIHLKGIRMT